MVSPNRAHYDFDVRVPESVIDQLREYGMEESIRLAKSGQASPEFVEGARRFYPMAFQDEAPTGPPAEPDPLSGIDPGLAPDALQQPSGDSPFYASVDGEIDPNLLAAVYRQFGMEPPRGEAPGPPPHPMDAIADQILAEFGIGGGGEMPLENPGMQPELAPEEGREPGPISQLVSGVGNQASGIGDLNRSLGEGDLGGAGQAVSDILGSVAAPLNSAAWHGLDAVTTPPWQTPGSEGANPLTHMLGLSPHADIARGQPNQTLGASQPGMQGPVPVADEDTLNRFLSRGR